MATVAVLPAGAGLTRAELRRARPRPRRARKVLLVTGACLSVLTTIALLTAGSLMFFLHLTVEPVRTGSMVPTYGPGWPVLMKPIPVADVRPGMIVTFVPPGSSSGYVHGVVTVSGPPDRPVITTKGDAYPHPDPWHAQLTSPTVPRVIWEVPFLGSIMLDLQERSTRVGLMGFGGFSTSTTPATLLNIPSLAATTGQVAHVEVSLGLVGTETSNNGTPPAQTTQSLSTTLTYTFTEQQRTPVVTNQ